MENIDKCCNESNILLNSMKDTMSNLKRETIKFEENESQQLNACEDDSVDMKDEKMFDEGSMHLFHHNVASVKSSTPKPQHYHRIVERPCDVTSKKSYTNKSTNTQIWSMDSRPVTFAKSQESNECNFQYVETVLPKFQKPCIKQAAKYDEDDVSDGSQSHTVFTIAKLMSNLNEQKEENTVLQEKLACLKSELASAMMELDLEKSKWKEEDSGKVSVLVEEIHEAEREREAAVLARLKLATQERDEARMKAKANFINARLPSDQLHHPHDQRLDELLDALCLASTARAAEKHSCSILDLMSKLRRERSRIAKEEMKSVVSERDNAIHQRYAQSEKINFYQERLRKLNPPANDLPVSQIRNCHITGESCDDDMERMRLQYSLTRSLRNEGCSCCNDAERLVEALRVSQEHMRLQEVTSHKREQEFKMMVEKNTRLERLVLVLRNKLTALAKRP